MPKPALFEGEGGEKRTLFSSGKKLPFYTNLWSSHQSGSF